MLPAPHVDVHGVEEGEQREAPGDAIDDGSLALREELVNYRAQQQQVDKRPAVLIMCSASYCRIYNDVNKGEANSETTTGAREKRDKYEPDSECIVGWGEVRLLSRPVRSLRSSNGVDVGAQEEEVDNDVHYLLVSSGDIRWTAKGQENGGRTLSRIPSFHEEAIFYEIRLDLFYSA